MASRRKHDGNEGRAIELLDGAFAALCRALGSGASERRAVAACVCRLAWRDRRSPRPGRAGRLTVAAWLGDSALDEPDALGAVGERVIEARVARAIEARHGAELRERDGLGALLARWYERLHAIDVGGAGARKKLGVYYTPDALAGLLLDEALRGMEAGGRPARVLDPACGGGALLAGALARLAEAHEPCRVVEESIFGVDLDPVAVEVCRFRLWEATGFRGDPARIAQHIRVGDSLLQEPAERFDLVVMNPPFVNAIEGGVDRETKRALASRFPEVRGAADLSYYFLCAASRVVREEGRIAMIAPRAILNAPSIHPLRQRLGDSLRPNMIFTPSDAGLFSGAAVYVCALVLGPGPRCRYCRGGDVGSPRWITGPAPDGSWWTGMCEAAEGSRDVACATTVGQVFEVSASMTAGDAYDVAPHVIDDPSGRGPKLLTTGLIDPGESLWGERPCRYLKRTYRHPRIDPGAILTPSVARRVARSRRPKIIVAGLSRRIECVLDETGEFIGAVSTFSVQHPADDLAALRRLLDELHSERADWLFRSRLAAHALGGGNVPMKRWFLREFPLGPEWLSRTA